MSTEAKELPAEVSQLDALELENLGLKAEKAQAAYSAAIGAYKSKFAEMAKKYQLNEADVVHFDTRKIERR